MNNSQNNKNNKVILSGGTHYLLVSPQYLLTGPDIFLSHDPNILPHALTLR